MLIRHFSEEQEKKILSPYAAFSSESRGRLQPDEECEVRTAFQRDRDRIIHCKSFRRLKHKTQVFIAPEGDHYRTRLTHTLEVSQIARTVAKALRLNEDLTEAIALGHDLGHTPFGHTGEDALNKILQEKCGFGFKHNEQSLRVVDILENMNLTWEVRDGILKHTGPDRPATLEGQIVKIADRVAYINHDIDDALRAGILSAADLPRDGLEILGMSHRGRINTMVTDLVKTSWDRDIIEMSPEVGEATARLRKFLFDNVYIGSEAKKEEVKARQLLQRLFAYFLCHPEEIPVDLKEKMPEASLERLVTDYVAGMTDRYAVARYEGLFLPHPWA